MYAEAVNPQLLDISKITHEVLQLLHLQAEAKKFISAANWKDRCLYTPIRI